MSVKLEQIQGRRSGGKRDWLPRAQMGGGPLKGMELKVCFCLHFFISREEETLKAFFSKWWLGDSHYIIWYMSLNIWSTTTILISLESYESPLSNSVYNSKCVFGSMRLISIGQFTYTKAQFYSQFMLICWLSSISSISVGMYPIVLMQFPKSLQPINPSLSLSNSLKASRNSESEKHQEIICEDYLRIL